MSDTLRKKLKQVEDDLAQLRKERADKIKARDTAREAFASTDGYDTDSDEYKAAHEAVKSVGEVDERISQVQDAQVGILRMLGQEGASEPRYKSLDTIIEERNAKALVESEAFKGLGRYADSKSRFGSVSLGELPSDFAFKAPGDDVAVGANGRRGAGAAIPQPLYRPLSVLDLIPTGQTNGNSVPYVQFAPGASAAAVVVEGARKPGGEAGFTDATADIETIAAWYKVRKQVLADAAAVQTILETQLRFDVRAALENYVVSEILGTTGIGAVAYAAGPIADQISHGMTNIILSNLVPDAVVLHPRDWERVRLAKDSQGNYQFGSPADSGQATIFGMPAVPSVGVAEGAPLVGAFRSGTTLFMRQGMEVLISDSDGQDFTSNRVTILGELRGGVAVWRPGAFSTVDITA